MRMMKVLSASHESHQREFWRSQKIGQRASTGDGLALNDKVFSSSSERAMAKVLESESGLEMEVENKRKA